MLLSIKDKEMKPEVSNIVLLMSGKELLNEVKKKEDIIYCGQEAQNCFDQYEDR